MEESKKFSAHSATHTSQPLQTSIGGAAENRVLSHPVRVFPADKSGHAVVSSAGTLASMPVTHVAAGSSGALQYQSISNEVKPSVVSGGMPTGHLGRNSSSLTLPKAELPQFRVDGGPNASSHVHQVQGNVLKPTFGECSNIFN